MKSFVPKVLVKSTGRCSIGIRRKSAWSAHRCRFLGVGRTRVLAHTFLAYVEGLGLSLRCVSLDRHGIAEPISKQAEVVALASQCASEGVLILSRIQRNTNIQSKPAIPVFFLVIFQCRTASISMSSTASILSNTLFANHFSRISSQICSTGFALWTVSEHQTNLIFWGIFNSWALCQLAWSISMRIRHPDDE